MAQITIATYSVYDSADRVATAAASVFARHAAEAVEARGIARIAISGGSTPKRMFELLASTSQPFRERVPWDKLDLYWVDERCVGPEEADSNYRMTRETLLDKVPLAPEHIHRMEGELDPEEAANRYESMIRINWKLEGAEAPVFDLVLLGMGDDGHTASLFPNTDALNELGRLVVANHVPQKDTWRLTLTWPVINQARAVVFLIEGQDKADVLHEVLLGKYDPEKLPSQLIRPRNGKLHLLLDAEAAWRLPKSSVTETCEMGTLELVR